MNLTEMLIKMRLEIQESVESVFLDTELTRGVQKCVSLMSRLIPKKDMLETTLVRGYSESLTLPGTLTYKPIKVGSLTVTGKTLDTDYRVNYLTGAIISIDSNLSSATYAVKYDLDPLMLDISSLLPEEDYIKIERIECPAGNNPPTYLTYDVFGELLAIRGSDVGLREDKHLRVIYQKPWTAPTINTAATLTTALAGGNNDLVFTARAGGAAGNAIKITYTDPSSTHTLSVAVSDSKIVVTLGYNGGGIISTAADIETLIETDSDAVALVSVVNASGNDGTGLVIVLGETALIGGSNTGVDGDYPEHLDNAVIIGAVGQTLIFKAEKYVQSAVNALSALTAPILHVFTNPTLPILPTKPDAPSLLNPTAPSLHLFTNPTLTTLPPLPAYPTTPIAPSPDYRAAESALALVSTEIAAAKAHHVTGAALANKLTVGARVAEIYGTYANTVMGGAGARANEALARVRIQEGAISLFASEVAAYGSKVNEYANLMSGSIGKYREQINGEMAAVAANGAMTAKYEAEIREELMAVSKYEVEVNSFASETNGVVAKYREQIAGEGIAATVNSAMIANYVSEANEQEMKARNFLDIAGRYLASGQAKINEFYMMLGIKPEFTTSKSSSEQRG